MERKSSWQNAFVYQVYPWTFNEDTHRDQQGHGSIRGITERLPYLTELGIDAIWISPFYPSPMIDGGYDIKEYTDINPDLGTLNDFDTLRDACHEADIKIMIDLVPNHTSNEHEWFVKSENREEGYDDWYIWHPGELDENGEHHAPNNWGSVFSIPMKKARENGEMPHLREDEWTPYISAWRWSEKRQEYYLAEFACEQPSLNWSNEAVREAMKNVMRFWLRRGVDGFRVDVLNHLGKHMRLRDEAVNTAYNENDYPNPYDQLDKRESIAHFPEQELYTKEIAGVAEEAEFSGRDIRMIFEAYSGEETLHRIDKIAPHIGNTFNFTLFQLPWSSDVTARKLVIDAYYEGLSRKGIGNHVNGNHDNSRLATRIGDVAARAAVYTFLLPGMQFVYNGEELGLHDADIPPGRVQDPNGLRDAYRTPMLFDDTALHAGFSNANPKDLYLPLNDDDLKKGLAANKQRADPKSMLSLYKAIIRLCKTQPATRNDGSYIACSSDNDSVYAFGRKYGDDELLVAVNFSPDAQTATITGGGFAMARKVLSSIDVEDFGEESQELNMLDSLDLRPGEMVVVVPNNDRTALWE